MKKLKIAVLATALVLSVAACGSNSPAPTVTVTEKVEAPSTTNNSGGSSSSSLGSESDMVDMIRSQDPWFYDVADYQIIETAYTFCDTLRSGATLDEIGAVAAETIGVDHAAVLGAGAILYLCPDQKSKIN